MPSTRPGMTFKIAVAERSLPRQIGEHIRPRGLPRLGRRALGHLDNDLTELALEGERRGVVVGDGDAFVAAEVEVAAGVPAHQERQLDAAAWPATDQNGGAADT